MCSINNLYLLHLTPSHLGKAMVVVYVWMAFSRLPVSINHDVFIPPQQVLVIFKPRLYPVCGVDVPSHHLFHATRSWVNRQLWTLHCDLVGNMHVCHRLRRLNEASPQPVKAAMLSAIGDACICRIYKIGKSRPPLTALAALICLVCTGEATSNRDTKFAHQISHANEQSSVRSAQVYKCCFFASCQYNFGAHLLV